MIVLKTVAAVALAFSSPLTTSDIHHETSHDRPVPCNPKKDPSCGNRTASTRIAPVPDPISTPGAPILPPVPCNPKKDPNCD